MSRAMTAKGFCVGPPIELTQGWTLEALLFSLLLGLCLAGRISFLWLGPQCGSFSLAGHPRLRSVSAPWGFDVLDYDTLVGNFHMHLSLVFLLPKCSPVKTPSLKHLSEHTLANFHGGDCWLAFEFRVDQCQFGVTYQKPTALLTTSPYFRSRLSKRCRGNHRHDRLEGSCTTAAPLHEQEGNCDEGGEIRDHRAAQRFVSHLWATQLAESLPWKVVRATPNHINILECHARRVLLQLAPKNSRMATFQDSMVTLGATAKGRSSKSHPQAGHDITTS